jgi:glycosyltransferase involved in cell wall biosynthesis
VDQTKFFPAAEFTRDPHVLFVGRLEKVKGAFDLLAAWERVQRAFPAALLTMIGQDCTAGRFLREARSLGLERSIRLTGPLPLPVVAEMMRRSRLFCLPSHKEGTPNCIMEALSSGLPVVATRVGGIPDIIEHKKTGLLVEKEDVTGLATALITLLSDAVQCAHLGTAAALFARDHLDARQTVSRLVELYGELVESHQQRQARS